MYFIRDVYIHRHSVVKYQWLNLTRLFTRPKTICKTKRIRCRFCQVHEKKLRLVFGLNFCAALIVLAIERRSSDFSVTVGTQDRMVDVIGQEIIKVDVNSTLEVQHTTQVFLFVDDTPLSEEDTS